MSSSEDSGGEGFENPFKKRRLMDESDSDEEDGGGFGSMNQFMSSFVSGGSSGTTSKYMSSFVNAGTETLDQDVDERSQEKGEKEENENSRRKDDVGKPDHVHNERYGIGAKLMAKMGYKAGKGLGAEGKGIVQPIEQKLRPTKLGLGGVDEKTRQEKERHGIKEDKKKTTKKDKSDVAEPTRKRDPKNIYKTMQEMEEEGLHVPSGFKHIIDMTRQEGGQVLEDMSEVSSGTVTPSGSNFDALATYDKARGQLDQMSVEWKTLQRRKEHTSMQYDRVEGELDSTLLEISRLRGVIGVVEDIQKDGDDEKTVVDLLDRLQVEYVEEVKQYNLDRVAVAALYPLLENKMKDWNPIENPTMFRDIFIRLRTILNGGKLNKRASLFDTMMYKLWLPKVRAYLSTEWDVEHPTSVILLLEEWENTLPQLVRNQLLLHVIVPRLKQAVEQWKPRKNDNRSISPPHLWLFPWLPYLGDSMSDVVDEVKRKFGSLLASWRPSKGSPIEGLESWKELFGTDVMENLLVTHLLPRLGDYMRKEFTVNPADQDITPLEHVVKWGDFVRPSTLGVIFEEQFFPKWLDVLYQWLISPECKPSEISAWFKAWQDWFPDIIREIPAVKHGFKQGLDLINAALDLKPSERESKLHRPTKSAKASSRKEPLNLNVPQKKPEDALVSTFKEVVEDFCANNDLFLISLKKAHPSFGYALFKISPSHTGHGGLTCYFEDDVLWIQSKQDRSSYEPISLDELHSRLMT
ncbi:hypothetical protein TRICI_001198 [Trichomonascus ciferrii]|uniref:G-patch domain-containing protein n=1 Tax=Trichomonascus ciferrii TaxID=44093 RepID=A0A642V8X4_9ASCO|nr:hypothetical protein TRICI_001198 [Trichomonascus ciferrii]